MLKAPHECYDADVQSKGREKGKEEGGDFSFGESPRCKGIEGEMKNEK